MTKIHVYFMPGMAASSLIFDRIKLTSEIYEMHFLEWILPNKNESLKVYAKRMAENIKHQNVILVGVSFGGILVQEMKPFVNPKMVIIISSVKSNAEFPKRIKIANITKAYKLIPTKLFQNMELLAKFTFGSSILKQKIKLYEKYLSVRDKNYLDWAIAEMINWDRIEIDNEIIHIHGDADEVFPIKYIRKCITVEGGTHIMIITKYLWLNENLPKIMLHNT